MASKASSSCPAGGRLLDERDLLGQAGLGLAVPAALVAQDDRQALVEEGHLLQPAADRVERVGRRLEDVAVGPEGDRGAALLRRADLLQRRPAWPGRSAGATRCRRARCATSSRVDSALTTVTPTPCRPPETRVALAVELPARVQDGHDDLDRGPLLDRVHVDRDATAVVLDPDAAVVQQGDADRVAVAGQRLVDGVVDDLPDHVVQAALTGGADVHAGALADRLEALENGDGTAGVGVLGGCRSAVERPRGAFLFAQPAPRSPDGRLRADGRDLRAQNGAGPVAGGFCCPEYRVVLTGMPPSTP